VLGAFGVLATILAATGVYGTMAYSVSRRTREIGIRMALGASSAQVLAAVLGRTGLLIAFATALGLGLALASGRFVSMILYGVGARDPGTFALAIALITVVALVASWVPARRAISVDPAIALRAE
jgi:ABC-type antimicrobial peptide transport system permease subunit